MYADRVCCRPKDSFDLGNVQRRSSQRHEYVVVEGGIGEAVFDIPFESCPRALVQGYEATFPELGIPVRCPRQPC